MAELNRREFVALTVVGTCACCAAAQADAPASQPSKKAPASQPAANPPGALDAGAIDQYPDDGVYDAFSKASKVLIVRHENRIYATSARCTHKGCTLKATDKTKMKCPCHGSEFDLNGVPVAGPAKVSLVRYAIKLKDDKRVIVNPKKQFAEKNWEKPDAFIEIKTS